MSLEIIKNDSKELTTGEKSLLNKINNIYKTLNHQAFLYIQPTICSLVPDFILIDETKGLAILEVKDWSIEYIKNINKKKVELIDREDHNPVYKTKKYLEIARGIVSTSKITMEFIEENIYAVTVLTNLTNKNIEETNIKTYLNQPPIICLTNDILKKLTLDNIFPDEDICINTQEMTHLRTLFFPESRIIKKINTQNEDKQIIKILDNEQENFAKKIPYGHYMVTGIPGSGKTVILIARAMHLIKENPHWNIKIMTYNASLKRKLESIINSIAEEIKDNNFLKDIAIQNISVDTFHTVALNIAKVRVPRPTPSNWWEEILPQLALNQVSPIYDAILIDEYQDFRDDWIRVCIQLCKKCKYLNSSNEEVEGINLFLAGDRLQSIYNPKAHNWSKDFGINMSGRSKLLKTSYRAGKENTNLALEFLQQNEELKKEVNKFYKENDDVEMELKSDENSSIEFIDGSYENVSNTIVRLLEEGYTYKDILVICNYNGECDNLKNYLPTNIKHNCKKIKEATEKELNSCLVLSTYHSAKGIESKVVILVNVQNFSSHIYNESDIMFRKLLYVGITRASQKLIIHANNFYSNSFAKDLKEIYEK